MKLYWLWYRGKDLHGRQVLVKSPHYGEDSLGMSMRALAMVGIRSFFTIDARVATEY